MRLEYCTSLWRLRFGAQSSIRAALALAAAGLPLMLLPNLPAVLTGMVLVGIGTFFAQACATGFVGQTARDARGIASGSYLASYFLGGLTGSAVLGRLFDQFGWPACLAGIAASLLAACLLSARLTDAEAHSAHFNQAVP
jgi:predicted MFS family arabinose efflux permease